MGWEVCVKNYRSQPCCETCRYAIQPYVCEEQTYYCALESPRPEVVIPKAFSLWVPNAVYDASLAALRAWEKERQVSGSGICDAYEEADRG